MEAFFFSLETFSSLSMVALMLYLKQPTGWWRKVSHLCLHLLFRGLPLRQRVTEPAWNAKWCLTLATFLLAFDFCHKQVFFSSQWELIGTYASLNAVVKDLKEVLHDCYSIFSDTKIGTKWNKGQVAVATNCANGSINRCLMYLELSSTSYCC